MWSQWENNLLDIWVGRARKLFQMKVWICLNMFEIVCNEFQCKLLYDLYMTVNVKLTWRRKNILVKLVFHYASFIWWWSCVVTLYLQNPTPLFWNMADLLIVILNGSIRTCPMFMLIWLDNTWCIPKHSRMLQPATLSVRGICRWFVSHCILIINIIRFYYNFKWSMKNTL